MIYGLFGFNSFPVLYLITCSFLYILFFWHRRCSSIHNSPRGIHSTRILTVFLLQSSSAHSNSVLTFPLASIPAQFIAILADRVKLEKNRGKMILSAEEDGFWHKAFSTWVDSCHTIPSTPPWTWSRLEPGVAAAYLPARCGLAPTQTPQAGQTGCYKLGSRTVAIFTRCWSDAKCEHQSNRIYSVLQTSFSGQSAAWQSINRLSTIYLGVSPSEISTFFWKFFMHLCL